MVDRLKPMLQHPDAESTHVRIPILDSRSESGIGAALDSLLRMARSFPRSLGENDDDEVPPYVIVTFHGRGRWLSERRFFERAARYVRLRPRIAQYTQLVNPTVWKRDPFRGTGFWTSILAPAGSLAIVPLALADAEHVDALLAHLRGVDLGHETFHRAFFTELLRRWGLCEASLRLLAFRAVDGAGQHGDEDLRWLAEHTEFGAFVRRDLEGFSNLVQMESRREKHRAAYLAAAGRGLFATSPDLLERWFGFFELHGTTFDARERAQSSPALRAPRPWIDEWNEAADCTDRD